jgi:hypothetical protein
MRAGQEKAGSDGDHGCARDRAGRGIGGRGFSVEDIEKDLNVLAINSNTTRAGLGDAQQGTDYSNEALLDRRGPAQ